MSDNFYIPALMYAASALLTGVAEVIRAIRGIR